MKGVRAIREAPRSLHICRNCRRSSQLTKAAFTVPNQRRWIAQDANQAWQVRAKDIEEGHRKSILTLLEERGYINQIVG
jgi:hypothetical protein